MTGPPMANVSESDRTADRACPRVHRQGRRRPLRGTSAPPSPARIASPLGSSTMSDCSQSGFISTRNTHFEQSSQVPRRRAGSFSSGWNRLSGIRQSGQQSDRVPRPLVIVRATNPMGKGIGADSAGSEDGTATSLGDFGLLARMNHPAYPHVRTTPLSAHQSDHLAIISLSTHNAMQIPQKIRMPPKKPKREDERRTLGSLKIATLLRIGDYVYQHVVFTRTNHSAFPSMISPQFLGL
jgi:hypothetical protein